MTSAQKILFVHDGLAFYPSMLASKSYFARLGFTVDECRRDQLKDLDLSDTVVWMMMGFYPHAPEGRPKATIHEYRSQSTGSFRTARDSVKRFFNHKPSYRLFQSERIRRTFNRNDGVPSGLLPLGVASDIVSYRETNQTCQYDFCYIGAISEERRIPAMLDGFIEAYGTTRTIALVGDVRDGIGERYARDGIFFLGRLSQKDTFGVVNSSSYSICFFPSHPPHCYQPPTKLYEYAALGRKIIANDSPANLEELRRLGICAHIIKQSRFPSDVELSRITDNTSFDPSGLYFDRSIESSGIVEFITSQFER